MSASDLAADIKARMEALVEGLTVDLTYVSQLAGAIVDYGDAHWTSGTGASLKFQAAFKGSGILEVCEGMDSAYIANSAFNIEAIYVYRRVAGVSGSTILDINKNGVSLYTTQANRPSIPYNDADHKILATLPDTVAIAVGDIITVDIDQVEGGSPEDIVLMIHGGS